MLPPHTSTEAAGVVDQTGSAAGAAVACDINRRTGKQSREAHEDFCNKSRFCPRFNPWVRPVSDRLYSIATVGNRTTPQGVDSNGRAASPFAAAARPESTPCLR